MKWKNLIGAIFVTAALAGSTSGTAAPPGPRESSNSASERSSTPQANAAPASISPADLQALLYKIYTENFRVGDLTGSLPIDQWKMSDQQRAALHQKTDALRTSTANLEKARSEFYNHPSDPSLAQATATALQEVLPQIDDYAKALDGTPGSNYVKDYQQAAGDLRELDRQIEPYIASLQPKPETPAAAPSASAITPPAQAQPAPSQPSAQPQVPPAENTQAPAANPPAQAAPTAPTPAEAEKPAAQASPTATQPTASAPTTASTQATGQPGVAPKEMQPAEAQALLYKIYAANFRVGDLTSSLTINQWKLSDQDQAVISQKADTLRATVGTVEKARNNFYNSPNDLEMGRATVSAIQSLLPKIDEFATALANTPGASTAKDYQQAAGDLRTLDGQLEPYVAYLEAKNQPPAPTTTSGRVTIQTEVIKPSEAPAPLTVAPPEKPPLDTDQLRKVLYEAYVPAFRIKDLLSQEQPDKWKISSAERTVYNDASQALTKRLADLASWRDQFESHPDSLEAAFEVYAALDKVAEPAGIVGQMVSQYDDPKIGSEYLEKSKQVAEFRNQVEPYVSFLLRRHDQAIGTVERNFVTCETELTSVMRPTTVAAEPMKNVLPVFRGRGRSVTRGSGSAKPPSHASKKKPAASTTKPAAAKSPSH